MAHVLSHKERRNLLKRALRFRLWAIHARRMGDREQADRLARRVAVLERTAALVEV